MIQPAPSLTVELAARLAHIALSSITREYPVYPDHVLLDDADLRRTRELHPAFYGCFDWHSAVHSHWLLARLLRLLPALPQADLMHRVLPATDFAGWLTSFLPRLADSCPPQLLSPAAVSDRSDGQIVHLDGLNLSRAWCM